jgi:hypothetical protein
VLSLLNKTKVALWHDNFAGAVLIAIHDAIEDMTPVNAVELPCKIGNNLYEICNNEIHEQTVEGISISKNAALINCESKNFYWCEIGDNVFFTREEAVRELSKRQGESE